VDCGLWIDIFVVVFRLVLDCGLQRCLWQEMMKSGDGIKKGANMEGSACHKPGVKTI
jgi:hypothetical protein